MSESPANSNGIVATWLFVPQGNRWIDLAGPGHGGKTSENRDHTVVSQGIAYKLARRLPAAPAPVGGIIITYATGLYGVEGMVVRGAVPGVAMPTLHPVEVVIGGVAVLPMFAGLHPTLVGLYQVNAVVPDVPAGEAVPIQLRISGVTSTDQATIAVSQALAAQNLPSPSGHR